MFFISKAGFWFMVNMLIVHLSIYDLVNNCLLVIESSLVAQVEELNGIKL